MTNNGLRDGEVHLAIPDIRFCEFLQDKYLGKDNASALPRLAYRGLIELYEGKPMLPHA